MNRTRVLYLVPDLFGPPGGIALYCRLVCKALSTTGVNLTVLAVNDRRGADFNINAICPNASYYAAGRSRLAYVQRALAAALRSRPAIILVGHPYLSPLGWALARLTGARMVVFVYGIDVWQPLSASRRNALRRADQIIAISQFTAQQAARINAVPLDKIRILYNCLDPQFERTGEPDKPVMSLSMLTVARMSWAAQYKGHDYVLRALPILLARFPHLVYHVVGDGDWRPEVEALAVRMGVAHAVQFHGTVSDEELHRLYAESSLFIMPSRAEGFGFVFLEAMSMGVPVIGGNVDATPEVIVDGETGYLVDPTSVEAIAEAAARLLSDEDLRCRMGKAAVRHVTQDFGFQQFQQRLLTYLAEVQPALEFGLA